MASESELSRILANAADLNNLQSQGLSSLPRPVRTIRDVSDVRQLLSAFLPAGESHHDVLNRMVDDAIRDARNTYAAQNGQEFAPLADQVTLEIATGAAGTFLLRRGAIRGTQTIANPGPRRLARVIETRFANSPTLGAPGATEVFVTGAGVRDIGRIKTSNGLARRLTLVDETGELIRGPRTVIEFDLPTGIASPINRTNPGFVGGGRTAGNAREFVIPNYNISDLKNVIIRNVP